MTTLVADVLVLIGVAIVTLGVIGLFRMPDVYTQLHAAGKAALVGVMAVLAAAAVGGEGAITARVLLLAAFLAITTPVASHAVARAAFRSGEPLRGHESIDESGRGLDRG